MGQKGQKSFCERRKARGKRRISYKDGRQACARVSRCRLLQAQQAEIKAPFYRCSQKAPPLYFITLYKHFLNMRKKI